MSKMHIARSQKATHKPNVIDLSLPELAFPIFCLVTHVFLFMKEIKDKDTDVTSQN